MKAVLAAALLVLTTLPAMADSACYTPAMIKLDVEKVATAKELTTLHSIDVGFDELADVIIWGDGAGKYLAVVFIDGCYAGNQIMSTETVEEFINEHTKRAEPL